MGIGDIVTFSPNVNCVAGEFCRIRGITGVITKINGNLFCINTGFGFDIYCQGFELVVVAELSEIPSPGHSELI